MFDPGQQMSSDAIKLSGAAGGAVLSNLTGIPFDRFRVLVAHDLKSTTGLGSHLAETFRSPGAAFTGGFARVSMKQMATSLNLYVPQETRKEYPFLSSFCVGAGFAPILNIPRVMQLGRIAGKSYPEIVKTTFMTGSGWMNYAKNTALFAPGEGLRMMMCFGMKDWLMPRVGGDVDVHQLDSVALHAAKMAIIAGPAVAAIETTAALVTETVSTIQAKVSMSGDSKKSFGTVLKETVTPHYTGRCWLSLFTKNVAANTPLFWLMFSADLFGRIASHREKQDALSA